MTLTLRRHAGRLGLAAIATIGFALGLTDVAGAAPGAPVVIVDTGILRAGGAAITFPVQVTCGPFDEAEYQWVALKLTQAVGESTAGGQGGTDVFTCDGNVQSVEITVLADALGGRHFEEGVAVVAASEYACGYEGGIETCNGTDQSLEVAIVEDRGKP